MASENVNVRVTGELRAHLQRQVGTHGLYENASEYIRDLIRRDLKSRNEAWEWLRKELADKKLLRRPVPKSLVLPSDSEMEVFQPV